MMTSKSRCDFFLETISCLEVWVSCLEVSELVPQLCLLASSLYYK